MNLEQLIDDPGVRIDAIASVLDQASNGERWSAVADLSRSRQRTLYEKASESAPIDLDFFVGDTSPRAEVVHDGLNTLPLPGPLRRFQKRFCRPEGRGDEVFGYNEGPTRRMVGPGYFVAVETRGRPTWESRGEVVIDYYRVPDAAVAVSWPTVVPNTHGLQRFVYHQTRDFMRRVSSHVSIGAAYKRERPLDHYFILCRQ